MSEKSKKTKTEAFVVDPLAVDEGESVLLAQPVNIINEILHSTNVFAAAAEEGLSAILYLGSAQRYAIRFINKEGLIDPMKGTFAGVPVIWVEASYHVNLVVIRHAEEQG